MTKEEKENVRTLINIARDLLIWCIEPDKKLLQGQKIDTIERRLGFK